MREAQSGRESGDGREQQGRDCPGSDGVCRQETEQDGEQQRKYGERPFPGQLDTRLVRRDIQWYSCAGTRGDGIREPGRRTPLQREYSDLRSKLGPCNPVYLSKQLIFV